MEDKNLSELELILDTMVQTPTSRRIFLASVPLMMAACASTEKTRYREGDNSGQAVDLSVADEQRMTKEVLPKMRKDYPLYRSEEVQSYIKRLGNKIVTANGLQGHPYNYNFSVVDVPYVNAFALPAGTVFITAPLIQMAETEAELAGVVGHEIGHITARHTAERMYKAKKSEKKSLWYALGGAAVGGLLGYGAGSLLCSKQDRECIRRATELGVAGGTAGGMLIQKYAFMANSREDEMEADRIGFRTSLKAGYSKDHIGSFYSKLLVMEQKAKKKQHKVLASIADAMSTHPPSKERVKQMRQMQAEVSSYSRAVVSTKSFENVKRKIGSRKKSS